MEELRLEELYFNKPNKFSGSSQQNQKVMERLKELDNILLNIPIERDNDTDVIKLIQEQNKLVSQLQPF